ncbi:MAG: hypothetical protein RIC95_03165 [Vicingaceae bacterium]
MRSHLQLKAWILLIIFLGEIFSPTHLLYAGSGPSQPEMGSFTPSSSLEMVDPFTGDFNYNIPLLDVEGYPVNLAYSSGVTMNQEASWVGLGWNLNVGAVTRSVRGLPDDFKGEKIETKTSIKPMKQFKIGGGIVAEIFGKGRAEQGLTFVHNNYKGFGLEYSNSVSAGIGQFVQPTIGYTASSLEGLSVNTSLGISVPGLQSKLGGFNFGGSLGTGYNVRTGQSLLSFGTTAGYSLQNKINVKQSTNLLSNSTSLLPIGMHTYTPYPSLKMSNFSADFSGALGTSVYGVYVGTRITGSVTIQSLQDELKETEAFGYLNVESAPTNALLDYNREGDITLNKSIEFLPPVNFTYDVFSASGEGVSGMFRPFRDDVGTLSAPTYSINNNSNNSLGGELGFGLYFHGGLVYNGIFTKYDFGSWNDNHNGSRNLGFAQSTTFGAQEKYYFKSAGDKSVSDLESFNQAGGFEACAFGLNGSSLSSGIVSKSGSSYNLKAKNSKVRNPRSKVFNVLLASEASNFALEPITSSSGAFYEGSYDEEELSREGEIRKSHHISEITQINPNGERFVYGIPVYNNFKKEVNYNTNGIPDELNRVDDYSNCDTDNAVGIDHYFSSTKTPSYAHSYLLTSKLSPDYQDITGDGVTPDDIGNAYKFNYHRTTSSYRWRTPYEGNTYSQGYLSNDQDEKGSYTYGEKELWYLHTIQSKNQVAEFYTSEREDALGVKDETNGGVSLSTDLSQRVHQLDSILLFDKLDRLKNKSKATPIKKVRFYYDSSLCLGVENSLNEDGGKLTLKKVEISYGKANVGKESPYLFTYSSINPNYNPTQVDRWGNYKANQNNPSSMSNSDFPYVNQNNDDLQDDWASAWSLVKIKTPNGGTINVEYESDDYGYVQNKRAMEMVPILGAGDDDYFDPSNPSTSLYGKEYLFFERPNNVKTDLNKSQLKNIFFGNGGELQNMYFRFLLNIHDKTEYVSGYTSGIDIGYADLEGVENDHDYLYLKIPQDNPNAITKTAWMFFRHELFNVLYQQPNIKNTGLQSIVMGIRANINDIKQMFVGVENHLKSQNIARVFTPSKSFVRLYTPDYNKIGGGSRVKRIYQDDNWRTLSNEGENSTYGYEYVYKTNNENGIEISSGVATYEPLIGNDENPFKEPNYFTVSQAQGHIPAIEAYQETPFGESFFPSASIGYSEVTVKNLHFNKGKTSKSVDEYKYHTAKDFPVIVDHTTIQKSINTPGNTRFTFPAINYSTKSSLVASQGYSIILNDMHGKLYSKKNFLLLENGDISLIKKLNNGIKYNYQYDLTSKGKRLNNNVSVLNQNKVLEERAIGLEYDLAIENRKTVEENITLSANANADIFPIPAFIPIPLLYASAGYKRLSDEKVSKYQVLTKVIQQYGLLESVEQFTDQYKQTIYNKVYDGVSGKVILTETEDEHLKNEFQLDLPAYMVQGQELMGPAYQTIGLRTPIQKIAVDSACNPDASAFLPAEPWAIKNGDEVIVYDKNNNQQRAWVLLDKDSKYNKAVSTCNPSPTPFYPKYRRLLTTFARQTSDKNPYYDSILPFEPNRFKRHYGQIMEDVKVYHLKDTTWAKKYDSLCQYSSLVSLNSCNIASPSSIGHVGGGPTTINHIYHNYDCDSNDVFYNIFDSQFLIINDKDDLSRHFTIGDSTDLFALFEKGDTLNASIEYLEADLSLKTEYAAVRVDSHSNVYPRGVPSGNLAIQYSPYKVSNNSCATYRYPSNLFEPRETNELEYYDVASWSAIENGELKTSYDTVGSSRHVFDGDTIGPYISQRKESRTSLRIEDKESFHPYLSKKHQLYLVEYITRNMQTGDSTRRYFIENGRGYETVPWKKSVLSNYCKKEDSLWEARIPIVPPENIPCEDLFRLVDRSGNRLNVTDVRSIKLIRPAARNQLLATTGSIKSNEDPLKLNTSETSQNNLFLGVDTSVSILEAKAQQYKDDRNQVQYFPLSQNPFVNGSKGNYMPDSVFAFKGVRSQSSTVKLAEDGYFEELPELWADLSCYKGIFPPDFDYGGSASGWRFKGSPSLVDQNGFSVENISPLGIYSTSKRDHRGHLVVNASNAKYQNLAFDDFEAYYTFGTQRTDQIEEFRFYNSGQSTTDTLLNEGSQHYEISDFSNDHIINGISHSGNKSLFVNREDDDDDSNLEIVYKIDPKNYLEQSYLWEVTTPEWDTLIADESSLRNDHFNSFTEGLKSSTLNQLNSIYGDANYASSISFDLSSGDSLAGFKPQSGKYLLSIWVKELVKSGVPYQGQSPSVVVTNNGQIDTLNASGAIIDGWQKIEGEFVYSSTSDLEITLYGGEWGAFYDDFRFQPFNAIVNTYVYDHKLNKLAAKLDENNYATFFEYDAGGIPAQVKRETDQGIFTIRESRQSFSKNSQ